LAKKIILTLKLSVITFIILFIIAFLLRTPLLSTLTINSPNNCKPDLIAVLGGGIKKGKLGISTKERLNNFIKIYNSYENKPKVLICEYPEGKKKMELYLEKKMNLEKFTETSLYKYSEKIGGTENNIKDIFAFANKNINIKNILIITSPYHEKRTELIIRRLKNKMKLNKNVKFIFLHIQNSGEILTCSYIRFGKLIFHEFGGIIYELVFKY